MSGSAGATGLRPRRPDESMTLLTELMERPLDPSYAAAAASRRSRGEEARRRPWNSALVGVAAGVLGVLLTTSAMTYGRLQSGRGDDRPDLAVRIEQQQERADSATERIAAVGDDLRRRDDTTLGSAEAARFDALRLAAGATPVQGPGLRVTLDDAAGLGPAGGGGPRAGGGGEAGRIVYRDLQNITNDLWATGAEAVTVNGHRLTSVSAIRFAGRAILVGFRPLARPYVIEAVMGPDARTAYLSGTGGAYLADLRTAYGARAEPVSVEALDLPAADTLGLRHAEKQNSVDSGHDASTAVVTPSTLPTRKDNG